MHYDNLLIMEGERERKKFVYIDWNMEREYGPFNGSHISGWFERYFLEILAGH